MKAVAINSPELRGALRAMVDAQKAFREDYGQATSARTAIETEARIGAARRDFTAQRSALDRVSALLEDALRRGLMGLHRTSRWRLA